MSYHRVCDWFFPAAFIAFYVGSVFFTNRTCRQVGQCSHGLLYMKVNTPFKDIFPETGDGYTLHTPSLSR